MHPKTKFFSYTKEKILFSGSVCVLGTHWLLVEFFSYTKEKNSTNSQCVPKTNTEPVTKIALMGTYTSI